MTNWSKARRVTEAYRPAVKPMITIVGHAGTCEIVLAELGFYVRCLNCPHVSEITHAKYRARMWAEEHDCQNGA